MSKKYNEFIQKIKEYGTIIIHRHGRPDGDAIGSQIGLREVIKCSYPYKNVYCVGDENEKFLFLGRMDTIADEIYKQALVIVLDSGDEALISDNRYKNGKYLVRIDHHVSKVSWGDLEILEPDEVSCASIIEKMVFELHLKLNTLGAKALFTGVVTDSGRFRYEGVCSKTFDMASRLMKYNFDLDEIYNNIYLESLEIVKLRASLGLAFKVSEGGVAYLKNTQDDIKKYKTDIFTISRGMVSVMSGIRGIDVWANFTEDENKKIIVEIRSSKYNINPVAIKYGGGGHKKASGTILNSFEEADLLIKDLEKIIKGENINE